ncbi:dipeptidase [Microbulbifer hydrolyticus]|uniref:Dipeptidase n=1 Tax=Microbulbifer hydrolyticus TaxID=48074 RepID=A0A6P1TCP5_9GAMM|nr:dipeptidase [Microbulbifer hydrolyticus]MBB5210491.1 dipeptidase D [Microbulbifer hydrolyticus]QHQ39029.1 dipeptidase [Microbulbifer hydrolyticus]
MKFRSQVARIAAALLVCPLAAIADVSPVAQKTAEYAVEQYEAAMTDTLADLVQFKTVAREDLPLEENPEFTGFKRALCDKADALGLECEDHGYVVIVALGDGKEKIGIVTHGDVQPANPDKWKKSPFELDRTSEPGKLIARGSEDDKGPIATALYAMKAIKDKGVPMKRRVELIVYLAEESDWEPLKIFLKDYDMPTYNITIDADYPVVTAEKGWSEVRATFADAPVTDKNKPYLSEFHGGYFGSQVPDEGHASIVNPTPELGKGIRARAAKHPQVKFEFAQKQGVLEITARGVATHSSEPEHGINAIAFLADALGDYDWPANAAGATVRYINGLIGTGITAEQFGDIAYSDDFMGPMTGALTMVKVSDKGLTSHLNLRRPTGKTAELLEKQIHSAIENWQKESGIQLAELGVHLGEPYRADNAPHVEPLLQVFRHFTGIEDAGPVSIGGSTNAKLLPNAVSFGPSMPDKAYTGHSEHEFITVDQFRLNLEMYTAMMIEISNL